MMGLRSTLQPAASSLPLTGIDMVSRATTLALAGAILGFRIAHAQVAVYGQCELSQTCRHSCVQRLTRFYNAQVVALTTAGALLVLQEVSAPM